MEVLKNLATRGSMGCCKVTECTRWIVRLKRDKKRICKASIHAITRLWGFYESPELRKWSEEQEQRWFCYNQRWLAPERSVSGFKHSPCKFQTPAHGKKENNVRCTLNTLNPLPKNCSRSSKYFG